MKLGPTAKTIVLLAAVAIAITGLKLAASFLVPLTTAIFITTLTLPIVRWLEARRFPRPLAILLAVLLDGALLAGLVAVVGSSVTSLSDAVPRYQALVADGITNSALWLDQRGIQINPDWVAEVTASTGAMSLLSDLLGALATTLSRAILMAFLVALLVLFMLFEVQGWRTKMAYLVGRPIADLPRFARAAWEVQVYLFVKTGSSVVTGLLCGGFTALCGLDFAFLWGVLAFMLNYIPTVGMAIATVPPVLVALLTLGPSGAAFVLGGYLVINFILGNLVEPRLFGRALGLSPLVVFLSMAFWGWLWGPMGALLSVPMTMVLKVMLATTEDGRWVAVLLGSKEWVQEMQEKWARAAAAKAERAAADAQEAARQAQLAAESAEQALISAERAAKSIEQAREAAVLAPDSGENLLESGLLNLGVAERKSTEPGLFEKGLLKAGLIAPPESVSGTLASPAAEPSAELAPEPAVEAPSELSSELSVELSSELSAELSSELSVAEAPSEAASELRGAEVEGAAERAAEPPPGEGLPEIHESSGVRLPPKGIREELAEAERREQDGSAG